MHSIASLPSQSHFATGLAFAQELRLFDVNKACEHHAGLRQSTGLSYGLLDGYDRIAKIPWVVHRISEGAATPTCMAAGLTGAKSVSQKSTWLSSASLDWTATGSAGVGGGSS